VTPFPWWTTFAACNAWVIEYDVGRPPALDPAADTVITTSSPPLVLPGPSEVGVGPGCDLACDASHPAFDVIQEWAGVPATGDYPLGTLASVGHLDDDDGDGVIGSAGDVPEVAAGAGLWPMTSLTVWRGDGSGQISLEPPIPTHAALQSVSIGDVDGDGVPEIVGVTGDLVDSQLFAVGLDGQLRWRSASFSMSQGYIVYVGTCNVAIADLEGDGSVEVLCDTMMVDGATGATLAHPPWQSDVIWTSPAVADLDLDGVAEVVLGNRAREADGAVRWTLDGFDGVAAYPTPAQLDDDPEGEVLIATAGVLHGVDTDGTVLWRTAVSNVPDAASPPCVADLDGDGVLEAAAAFGDTLAAFELDGSVMWTAPVSDASSAAGCAAFDFDLDGRAEIAYADERSFTLRCGPTGEVLYQDLTHRSGTLDEYPVPVDVDGDGATELLVSRSGTAGDSGFVVYGARTGWPPSGDTWAQFDAPEAVLRDGRVQQPQPVWLGDGLVHSRAAIGEIVPPEPLSLPDVGIFVADQRHLDDGGLALVVQIENTGPGDADAGRILEVHAVDALVLGQEESRLVRSYELPAVPSGVRLGGVLIELSADEVGTAAVRLVVPDGGPECDLDNQSVLIQVEA
jgi:hypothetical protein